MKKLYILALLMLCIVLAACSDSYIAPGNDNGNFQTNGYIMPDNLAQATAPDIISDAYQTHEITTPEPMPTQISESNTASESTTVPEDDFEVVEIKLFEQEIDDMMLASMVESGEIPADVTHLHLHSNLLSDIAPLKRLDQLRVLHLSANQISDISTLASLTNITWLTLGFNEIDCIAALAGMQNLERLDLMFNQISDLSPLAGLTNLTYLDIANNRVSDITPLANLTNLTYLRAHGNQISDLSALSGLISLVNLLLSGNQISDLSPLAGLMNLETLILNDNDVSDISPLAYLTNLEWFFISINFDDNTQITDWSPVAHVASVSGRP